MTTFAQVTCLELLTKCIQNETKNIDLCDEFCRRCQPRLKIPTVVLVVFILIAVSSFLVNGFMCVVYSLSKEMRTVKHYFMVNLFISNGFIAVFVIPFYLTQYTKDDSKILCQIGSVVDVLCCTCSTISLTAITTERFVAVKYPLQYTKIVSRKRCLAVICFAWAYSVAYSFAARIPVGDFDINNCVFFTDSYLIFTTFASFLLPLLLMLIICRCIFNVGRHKARPNVSNRMKREFKAAKTLTILIIGAFVVSWLPFFCYIWLLVLYKVEVPCTDRDLNYIIEFVRYLNGLVNPFIYVGLDREFRRCTFKLLRRIFLHKERNQ